MHRTQTKQGTGQVVVITGATAGVGRAAAREFARTGASCVALLARDRERLDETCAEIERMGVQALALVVDVANADEVECAAQAIEETVGPIGVWVNNAMATIFSPIEGISPEEFKRVTEVTYLGTVHGTMSALRRMRERNRGVIIQVGSTLAHRAIPLQSAYCGAKHAVRGFTDAIRSELIHDRSRVRISMVQLPGVNTPQFEWARTTMARHPQPVGTVYQPEVAARAIVWAAAHPRRELHVGAPALGTIMLNKFLPGWLDRLLARKAYEQQFTPEAISTERPDNLFHPVASPWRAHGVFEERARRSSAWLWASMHREVIGAAVVLTAAFALLHKGGRADERRAALRH
jgi:NADP-dependent 3-hydroxy acid dehydrogenase YdfG